MYKGSPDTKKPLFTETLLHVHYNQFSIFTCTWTWTDRKREGHTVTHTR